MPRYRARQSLHRRCSWLRSALQTYQTDRTSPEGSAQAARRVRIRVVLESQKGYYS